MKMGDDYQQKMVEALASAHASADTARTGKMLHIKSGKPVNIFDPPAWAAAFTEFFYGDCAPNLERPAKITWRHLFKYLMNREELEYHLDTDIETYGRKYVANPDSRWNTPEFAALATDAVRKLAVLQSTKAFWDKTGHTFKQDMRVLAGTTDKHFEDFQLNLQKAALLSVLEEF